VAISEVVVGGQGIGSLQRHQLAEEIHARLRVAKPQTVKSVALKPVERGKKAAGAD